MANTGFNPEMSTVVGTNYLNASQGRSPNKALGVLFEGIGDTIKIFSADKKAKEEADKESLLNAVSGGIDSIAGGESNTETGQLFPTPSANPSQDTKVPSGLQNGMDSLTALQSGYSQGVLSDTAYHMQLAKLSKKLKAQYPQYAGKIDALISETSGVSTANQLRKVQLAEIEAEQKAASDEEKQQISALKDYSEYLGDTAVGSVVRANYKQLTGKDFNPSNFNRKALILAVSPVQAEDAELKRKKDRVEYETSLLTQEDKVNDRTKRLMLDAGMSEAALVRDRLLTVGLSGDQEGPAGAGSTKLRMDKLEDTIRSGIQDGGLSPEEKQNVIAMISSLELDLTSATEQMLSRPDESGRSYLNTLSAEQNDNIRKTVMLPLAKIKEAFAGKETDLSVINAIKIDNEARKAARENELLKRDGSYVTTADQAEGVWGKEVVQKARRLLLADPGMTDINVGWDAETKAVAQKLQAMFMNGRVNVTSTLKEAAASGSLPTPAAGQAALKSYLAVLNDPEVQGPAFEKQAGRFFADNKEIIKEFGKTNPKALFDMLVTPQLTEKLKGTRAMVDYSEFAYAQAVEILKPFKDEMIDAQVFGDSSVVKYDPSKKRFTFDYQQQIFNPFNPLESLTAQYDMEKSRRAANAVSSFNSYLDRMEPIIAANGDNMETFLSMTFLDRDFSKLEKEGSLLTRFKTGIVNSIRETLKPTGVKPEPRESIPLDETPKTLLNPMGDLSEGPSAVKVVSAGKGWTEIQKEDGSIERRTGARNWRNNNPGNIEYGKFAKTNGAIGSDGRFAIFKTYEDGRAAKAKLLFESPSYKNKTILGAIARYAPSFENDTNGYARQVAEAAGVSLDTPVAALSENQKVAMLDAMQRVEGFRKGKVTKR